MRSLFSKPKQFDSDTLPIETKIVKVKCLNCGKEFIIYDNRIHGANTVVNRKKDYSYSDFIFKEFTADSVKILLEYDWTADYYNNKFLMPNKKPYEDVYSYIKVYAHTNDNREIKIFEDDTY